MTTPQKISQAAATLFPMLPFAFKTTTDCEHPRSATGLARMALQSPVTDEGHQVEYHQMTAHSILNQTSSQRGLGFEWSINPYRGCEFACRYCYARYTHEFMELEPRRDFESKIFIKHNAAHLLRQELRRLPQGQTIAIGTATDPYQPIERKEELTRSLLEVFAQDNGRHRIGILTKSVLILRDIELLQAVAARHDLTVNLTITTDDTELARKLEPRAPRPDLRFRAVLRLREAGIRCGVLVSPAMPGINDSQPQLDRMAYLAAAAQASFFCSGALFLKPGTRPVFEAFVEENFPHLLADLRRRFVNGAFQSQEHQRLLATRVRNACKLHGLAMRQEDELLAAEPVKPALAMPQLVSMPPRQSQLAFDNFLTDARPAKPAPRSAVAVMPQRQTA